MKRLLISLLFIVNGFFSQSQMIVNPYFFASPPPSCPTAFTFSLTGITQSPTGTYSLTSPTSDGNGVGNVVLPSNTEGSFQADYVEASNTFAAAICWDENLGIGSPSYSTARYVFFPLGDYYYNDDQAGATSTGIAAVDGDFFRLYRKDTVIGTPTQVVWAQIYRGAGPWTNLYRFSINTTAALYYFISMANNGTDILRVINPKHCGASDL